MAKKERKKKSEKKKEGKEGYSIMSIIHTLTHRISYCITLK